MKTSEALKLLESVMPAVDKRSSLPILSHVLVESAGPSVTFTATNLELTLQASIDRRGTPEFKTCLPSKAFRDALRTQDIEFDPVVEELVTRIGALTVAHMDPNDYPLMEFPIGETITAPTADVLESIKTAALCASTDKSRFNMNAVLLDGPAGMVVGCDGHTMARTPVTWIPETWKLIIPLSSIKAVLCLLKKHEAHKVSLALSENKRNLIIGTCTIAMVRLVDGDYPNHANIADPTGPVVEFPSDMFRKALDLATTVYPKGYSGYRSVRLHFQDDGAVVHSYLADGQDAMVMVPARYVGEVPKHAISFQSGYLYRALDTCNGTVKLHLSDDYDMKDESYGGMHRVGAIGVCALRKGREVYPPAPGPQTFPPYPVPGDLNYHAVSKKPTQKPAKAPKPKPTPKADPVPAPPPEPEPAGTGPSENDMFAGYLWSKGVASRARKLGNRRIGKLAWLLFQCAARDLGRGQGFYSGAAYGIAQYR